MLMFFQADSSLADTQWSQSLKNLIIGGIYKPCGQPRGRGVPKMSMFVHMGEGGPVLASVHVDYDSHIFTFDFGNLQVLDE